MEVLRPNPRGNPTREVLICGGGNGGAAREVLKHTSVGGTWGVVGHFIYCSWTGWMMAVISYDPEGDSRTTYDHLILKAATVLHFDMMFSWFTRTFAQFFGHHGHEQWIKTPVDHEQIPKCIPRAGKRSLCHRD